MAKYSNEYDEIIKKYAEKYQVDYTLIKSVIAQESSFDEKAYNKGSGASGLMQLLPSTYKEIMGKSDASDIMNPESNIEAGTKYLSLMLKKYKGDKESALASYYAGSNNVDKNGKGKYSTYYDSVLTIEEDLISGGDVYELSGTTTTPPKINTYEDVKWWGDIVIVVFSILLIGGGVVFLAMAVSNNSAGKKAVKTIKNAMKGSE